MMGVCLLPTRMPPPRPEPPRGRPSRAQVQRYYTALRTYYAGEALREYAASQRVNNWRVLPDELPYLNSPNLGGSGGGRRLAENGTPSSMNALCRWIDRQTQTVDSIHHAYGQLTRDLPVYARIAWLRHVNLLSIEEITVIERLHERTVVRYLGVANLRLMAALEQAAGTKTGRRTSRRLSSQADTLEAEAWREAAQSA